MSRLLLLLTGLLAAVSARSADGFFSTEPRVNPEVKRNYYWKPLASFLVPSLDQWVEQQWGPAALYAGIGGSGLAIASHAERTIDTHDISHKDLEDYDDAERRYVYGLQLYSFAGELSAFQSFRTAVKTRQADGEFSFLTTDETPGDLLMAPFDFSQLRRPTTFVPLLLLTAIGVAEVADGHHRAFDAGDAGFASGLAYNAGVGEEALFRGYLMPVIRQDTESDVLSNAITSLAFGLAHVSPTNPYPVFQTLFGFYLGNLVQQDDWSLRQTVFLHAWWDVLAIGFAMASRDSDAVIALPAVVLQF